MTRAYGSDKLVILMPNYVGLKRSSVGTIHFVTTDFYLAESILGCSTSFFPILPSKNTDF